MQEKATVMNSKDKSPNDKEKSCITNSASLNKIAWN